MTKPAEHKARRVSFKLPEPYENKLLDCLLHLPFYVGILLCLYDEIKDVFYHCVGWMFFSADALISFNGSVSL